MQRGKKLTDIKWEDLKIGLSVVVDFSREDYSSGIVHHEDLAAKIIFLNIAKKENWDGVNISISSENQVVILYERTSFISVVKHEHCYNIYYRKDQD